MTDNPKQAEGAKKVPFSAIPWRVIARLAVAISEGVKYGYHNYRVVGDIKDSTYFDATMRHLVDHAEGNTVDRDSPSGRTNLEAAMASLAVWIDAIHAGTYVDDRPPRTMGFDTFMGELNRRTVMITEKTEKKTERYTEAGRLPEYEAWRDEADAVYSAIAHGDPQRRAWLRDTLNKHYASKTT